MPSRSEEELMGSNRAHAQAGPRRAQLGATGTARSDQVLRGQHDYGLALTHHIQQFEIRVRSFQRHVMTSGTRGDDQVGGWNRNPLRTRAAGQIECGRPYLRVDREFRQDSFKVMEHCPFPASSRSVPKFQLHERAPARLSVCQRRFYTAPHVRVTAGPEHVYPGRRINQDQRLPPGDGPPGVRPAQSTRSRCRRTG